MKLSLEEQAYLAGENGAGVKKAMEILAAIGKIFNAEEMIPIASTQIAGVSYLNIGDPGLEFLQDWSNSGATVSVPAFMNPAGIDRQLWQQLGISPQFVAKQLQIIDCLQAMGVKPTLTCTPYHIGYSPVFGQHIAWSESSAVSYANSVLGARTNREGGPSALAAAIVGRTPKFGLHLEQNRQANYHVTVNCKLTSISDYGLLGYWIGKQVGAGIPYFQGLELPEQLWQQTACFKALSAAMAASGAVALYHIHEITPEANEKKTKLLLPQAVKITIDSLEPAKAALKNSGSKIDLVTVGCPHLSFEELEAIVTLLKDQRVKIPLWITTSSVVRQQVEESGLAQIIQKAGGTVLADTCMVVSPLAELGFKSIAVDSAKAACYLPSHQGAITYWGTTEQCVQSAIEGIWKF